MSVGKQITPHTLVIACTDAVACSDRLLKRLSHGPQFQLRADAADDTLHGSVTIQHKQPPEAHVLLVEVYLDDEGPIPGRKSTFKRPHNVPSHAKLRKQLDTPEVP